MSAVFEPDREADLKGAFFAYFRAGYWRPPLIRVEDLAMNLSVHRDLRSRGDKWMRRTRLHGWYVRHDSPVTIALKGCLQFVCKPGPVP